MLFLSDESRQCKVVVVRLSCTLYRELVTCFGNGVVYELMREAEALCEVICRDLHVTPAGASYRLSRYQLAQPQPAVTDVGQAAPRYSSDACYSGTDQLLVDDRSVPTTSRSTTYDDDQLYDVDCWSTTPAVRVVVIKPPDLDDDDDDDESLRSSMIANGVNNFNVDYDAHTKWQRRHYC